MKCKFLFCILLPLLISCSGKRTHGKTDIAGGTALKKALQKADILRGEAIVLDTALFRYAYRIRVQNNRAIVLDLHNADYYYHVFTYPDFHYLSSFGKRGEGPGESIYASNVRFAAPDTVWVLDDGKGHMYRYSGITGEGVPQLENDLPLDKRLFRPLDFDLLDPSVAIIPDYSGENRFCWASLTTGDLLHKSEQIPLSDTGLLAGSASAVAQGWRSFVSFTPDKKRLVSVTQLGDRLDIYDLSTHTSIAYQGEDGEPQFEISMEGYGYPSGRKCYNDLQVTDRYIYAIYDGREFKEIIKDPAHYLQGGLQLRVFNHQGELVKIGLFDRHVSGLYVDESRGLIFATDVNADEQLIRYSFLLE